MAKLTTIHVYGMPFKSLSVYHPLCVISEPERPGYM